MTGISVDGKKYNVYVKFNSMEREFEIVEGKNSTVSILGRSIRDILGTSYTYSMNVERNPFFPTDYDDFYDAISAPVESHVVELPYGQETIEFEAKILRGKDTYGGELGVHQWKKLSVTFIPMEPQRTEE